LSDDAFLSGVIEGFYGQPWTRAERLELFDRMTVRGLNTYFYTPKDDLHHRVLWREPYSESAANELGDLIRATSNRNLHFVYGLAPGLDIRYGDDREIERLRGRFQQMLNLGCRHFSLLFDDIPDRMDSADLERWGSLGSAQCHVANTLFDWIRGLQTDAMFLFCPTAYCGRMANAGLGGQDYLATVGRELLPDIEVIWTGPDIISREITVADVQAVRAVLRRKPLIWDNLHANDYDGHRFFCGPFSGRPLDVRSEVRGILTNPNTEFPLNYVPVRTLAMFLHAEGSWDARTAYGLAMEEWLPSFETVGGPVALADLMLFGDCYYLPHEEGPEAMAFYERAHDLLAREPATWGDDARVFLREVARLREFCGRMTELHDRRLFHALSRRVWELREELDLLERYVRAKATSGTEDTPVRSDFHLPGTFRGGMAARLRRLLVQRPDGTFIPGSAHEGVSEKRDTGTILTR
jgi:protein O-GlcNAcase/histone acetyltransferase